MCIVSSYKKPECSSVKCIKRWEFRKWNELQFRLLISNATPLKLGSVQTHGIYVVLVCHKNCTLYFKAKSWQQKLRSLNSRFALWCIKYCRAWIVDQIYLKLNLSPVDYEMWNLQNLEQNCKRALKVDIRKNFTHLICYLKNSPNFGPSCLILIFLSGRLIFTKVQTKNWSDRTAATIF